jgi:phage terminase small subunit
MGKRGIPPAPTALKVLHGVKPSRINQAEPKPDAGEVLPPRVLDPRAQAIWDRLAPDMIRKGVLTPWDVDSLRDVLLDGRREPGRGRRRREARDQHAPPWSARRSTGRCIYDLRKNPAWQVARESATLIVTLGGRFGLNPSDRSQLSMGEASRDADDDLLTG